MQTTIDRRIEINELVKYSKNLTPASRFRRTRYLLRCCLVTSIYVIYRGPVVPVQLSTAIASIGTRGTTNTERRKKAVP